MGHKKAKSRMEVGNRIDRIVKHVVLFHVNYLLNVLMVSHLSEGSIAAS